jgi:hypothetical protein
MLKETSQKERSVGSRHAEVDNINIRLREISVLSKNGIIWLRMESIFYFCGDYMNF